MQIKYVFLPDYPLVLSLLKPRDVEVFWKKKKKKKSGLNRGSILNSSIDKTWYSEQY